MKDLSLMKNSYLTFMGWLTLQELMEEATGDILDKTKALLAELG